MNNSNLTALFEQIFGSPTPLAERRTVEVHPDTLKQMSLLGLIDLVSDGQKTYRTYAGYPLVVSADTARIDVDPATLFRELIQGEQPAAAPRDAAAPVPQTFVPYEIEVVAEAPEPLEAAEFEPLQRFPKRELLADLSRAAGSLSAAILVISEQVELLEGDE